MASVVWSQEAERWLQDIFAYIAKDNAEAARKVVEGIRHKARLLADFPEMGPRHRSVADGDVRTLLYGPYRIAYLYKREQDEVAILGVFHTAMDLERYLP